MHLCKASVMRGLSNSFGLVSALARLLICICGLASGFTGQMLLPVLLSARAGSQRAPFRNDIDMLYFSFTKTAIEDQSDCDTTLPSPLTHLQDSRLSEPSHDINQWKQLRPLKCYCRGVCVWLFSFAAERSEAKEKGVCERVQSWGNEREGVCARDF